MSTISFSNETLSFKDLSKKVEKDDKMTTFRLKDVKIEGGERDMVTFSKAFRGHPNLEVFELVNVTVLDADVTLDQVISMLLITVPCIETLKLDSTKISSDAIATVGYCSTLKNLYMPNNDINDEQAKDIANAIAQSKTVEKIDLTGNDLSDVGCLLFSKCLEKNLTISEIKLDGNGKISGENMSKIELKLRDRAGGVPQAA